MLSEKKGGKGGEKGGGKGGNVAVTVHRGAGQRRGCCSDELVAICTRTHACALLPLGQPAVPPSRIRLAATAGEGPFGREHVLQHPSGALAGVGGAIGEPRVRSGVDVTDVGVRPEG